MGGANKKWGRELIASVSGCENIHLNSRPHCIQKGSFTHTGGQSVFSEFIPFEHKTVFTNHIPCVADKTCRSPEESRVRHQ